MIQNQQFIKTIFELQSQNTTPISISERKRLLRLLKREIVNSKYNIVHALGLDLGKSAEEAEVTEILPLILEINLFLRKLDCWAREKKVCNNLFFLGSRARIVAEPWGNVLIISPWNYPFQLPLLHLISSVAAGNRTIIKPSEFTPHTNKVLNEIIKRVFQPNRVQVIEGEIDTATELLQYPFDHIHFTGSPTVGKIVMKAASEHLSHCTLELGGKSPLIIDNVIDMKLAVRKLLLGKIVNAGQTCIAPDYVIIPAHRVIELKNVFEEELAKIKFKKAPFEKYMTKIIHIKHFDRLESMLNNALYNGANQLTALNLDRTSLYFEPILVSEIQEKDSLLEEEIFGPIIPVVTYTSYKEIINIVNAKPKPLAMYIMSDDNQFVRSLSKHTSAGAIVVNDVLLHIMHPNLPFGGANYSGLGYATGRFGFEDFSHFKPVLKTNKYISPTNFMGPYQPDWFKNVLDILIR